ncbi:hypothetical protein HDU99_000776, partial [Rhizoclosmatium hyalinum]
NNYAAENDPDKTVDGILDDFGSLSVTILEPFQLCETDSDIISRLKKLISDKEARIVELESKLENEKLRRLAAEQNAAAAVLKFDRVQEELKTQTNQIISFKHELSSVVSEACPNSTWNIAIANIILMMWDTFQNPQLLKKCLPSGNGFITLNMFLGDTSLSETPKISAVFAINYLVNSRISWLSVGSGDCSLEGTLISMIPRDEDPKIAISPTTAVSLQVQKLFPEIHRYIKSEIDAENLDNFSQYNLPDNSAILFNCPWARERNMTPTLLKNFMLSAARIQTTGCYLFLGITENSLYFDKYQLKNLFAIVRGVYTLDLIDVGFMEKVKFGYTHHSDSGKRLYSITEKHVMLCFKRN